MDSDSAQRDKFNKEYLRREVNLILEPLMVEVVKQKPENQVFISPINVSDQIYVEILRRQF